MTFAIKIDPPPLREEPSGAIRIGQTRVLLELVVEAFQDGATPETIVQSYDTLSLSDVYAVIAYYLKHLSEINEYMERRDHEGDEFRKRVESQQDLKWIRERLLKQRKS